MPVLGTEPVRRSAVGDYLYPAVKVVPRASLPVTRSGFILHQYPYKSISQHMLSRGSSHASLGNPFLLLRSHMTTTIS